MEKYGIGGSGRLFSPFGMFHLMYILFKKDYVKLYVNACHELL